MTLTTEQRAKLKGAGYSDSKINAFEAQRAIKQSQVKPKTGMEKSGKVGETLGSIFGGNKIGEAIGTGVARRDVESGKNEMDLVDYSSLSPQAIERLRAKGVPVTEEEQRAEIAQGIKGPSGKEIAGDVAQIGLNFVGGGAAKGLKGVGLAKKVATGAGIGYGYDVSTGLKDGDSVGKSLVPGVGTAIGGAIPLVGAGLNAAGKATSKLANKTVDKLTPDSASIMDRVARLKPTDATKFKKLAGKSHGEYLRETGNFGTPDKIIESEAKKFSKSVKSVDNTLAKLKGNFKDGSIDDALNGILDKAKNTSGANVKSPYLKRVTELLNKNNEVGLSMTEINEVKRLFEKNVKLGYNKLTNGDMVEKATNIDTALRKWQVLKAKELGFKNIDKLNKQTQLSKFIIDKLGDQVVGKSGLNGVSLTDWIMLSGGDPTAVGGFLTKKIFSSNTVQSKIAQIANKGKIKGQIKPNLSKLKPPRLPKK